MKASVSRAREIWRGNSFMRESQEVCPNEAVPTGVHPDLTGIHPDLVLSPACTATSAEYQV